MESYKSDPLFTKFDGGLTLSCSTLRLSQTNCVVAVGQFPAPPALARRERPQPAPKLQKTELRCGDGCDADGLFICTVSCLVCRH